MPNQKGCNTYRITCIYNLYDLCASVNLCNSGRSCRQSRTHNAVLPSRALLKRAPLRQPHLASWGSRGCAFSKSTLPSPKVFLSYFSSNSYFIQRVLGLAALGALLGLDDGCSACYRCSSEREKHGVRRLADQVPSIMQPVLTRTNDIYSRSYSSGTSDWKAKYNEVADMLAETRAELDEFHSSSKELEEELIKEIDRTEKAQQDLKVKVARSEAERDEWKVRCQVNWWRD